MPRHDLDHLRTFLTTARTGSFTEAGALLGISQPTVTAHIQALEHALGYPVLVRGRGGVEPTSRGALLLRSIEDHVDALDDVVPLGRRGADGRALHIGGPAEFLSTTVIPNLAFLIADLNAPIHLTFGLPDPLLDALAAGSLDLVVSSVPPRRRGISSTPLVEEEFVLVGAPDLVVDPSTSIESLPIIAYSVELPIIRRYWRTVFGRPPADLVLAAVIPDLRGIAAAVRTGIGMSVLPRYLIADDLDRGLLRELHSAPVVPSNTVYLAVRGADTTVDRLARLIRGLV